MSLYEGRMHDLVMSNLDGDTALTCHQTLYRSGVPEGLCRGYVDAYGDRVTPLRVAAAMGIITYVTPPEKEEAP
jgi:hypothetical protein